MKRILFVDEQQFVLDSYKRLLRDYRSQWQMEFVLNGKMALEMVKGQEFDLIITDIRMPEMSGLELLERLKSDEKTKYIPVVILTGEHDRSLRRKSLELGAIDFLNKPVTKEDLVARINNILLGNLVKAELLHFKNIVATREEIIKALEKKVEYLSKTKNGKDTNDWVDRYKAICGSLAHSLKGEFLHIGFASGQIRESVGMSTEIKEECDVIDRSMLYSRVILQQLLDYVDMGKPRMESIEIFELIKKTELLARPRLKSNITLHVIVASNIKKHIIYGNFEQLMGVLLELINNASKAMLNKIGKIDLTLNKRDRNIEISVSDDGSGIPPKIRKKLFKQQVPSKSGLGLGLFLSNKVIQELGGKLILKSSSSKGTTFLLLLPTASNKKEV